MNAMLTIMLVFRAYLAESVILSEWSKTDCEGPPTSMVVFELSDPTAESASDNNETWPYTYEFFRNENPIDFPCYYYGQGYFTINDGELCCASSLQVEETVVQSAYYVYLDVDDISNSLPVSIGNSHYCQFTNSILDPDTLMGYQSVYVLQGQCFHGIYCTNDSFSLYEFENCTDLIETYSISDVLETYDTSIGIIDGVRVLVEKGTRRFVWTTYIPDRLLLPSASNLLSVLHITMLCIGLVGFMTSCVFFGVRYHHRRLRIDLLLFLTQIVYLVLLGIDLVYKFTIVSDGIMINVMQGTEGLLSNISQILGTITTWKMLYETFVKEENRRLYVPIGYAILFVIHFALTGSDLGWFFTYFDQEDRIYLFLTNWSRLNVYWIILMYVWNLCPIILLFRSLLDKKSDKGLSRSKRLWKYLQKDILFLSAILLYILNGMCFFAMSIIYNYYSKIWGNDRSMWAAYNVTVLLIAYHTLTHGVLLHRLPYVMELKQHTSVRASKKKSHSRHETKEKLNK